MKIAFISDIHSNLEALQAVMKEINKINPEKIYCIGDPCGYNANPNECIELIKKLRIPSVLGNHEQAVIKQDMLGFNIYATEAIEWTIDNITNENLEFIKTFPKRIEVEFNELKILIVHGSPFDPVNEYVFPDYPLEKIADAIDEDVIVMGHTHVPFVEEVKDCLVINSGAVGQPRDRNPDACYVILDTETRKAEIFRVKYDIKTTTRKIVRSGLPQFLAERLYLGV